MQKAVQFPARGLHSRPRPPPEPPMTDESNAVLFSDLGLSETVVRAVKGIGYESASPIQAATIPAMLEGADILGQAQTGTGKTAAFALPILSTTRT